MCLLSLAKCPFLSLHCQKKGEQTEITLVRVMYQKYGLKTFYVDVIFNDFVIVLDDNVLTTSHNIFFFNL